MPLELEVVETTKTYDAFAQNMTQMDSKFASYDSIEDVLEKFKVYIYIIYMIYILPSIFILSHYIWMCAVQIIESSVYFYPVN